MKTKLFLLALAICSFGFYSCDDDENNNNHLSSSMQDFISAKYEGARIIEVDREGVYIEVDIWHQNTSREVVFNKKEEWLWTETDIRFSSLPEQIKTAYQNSTYTAYRIDDIDHFETPNGEYYVFEFDLEPHNLYIKIYTDGRIEEM